MPRKRQPREIWRVTRLEVWERDGRKCVHCGAPQALEECHIDHIVSGKRGTNEMSNLRTLCVMCHALRNDRRHDGLRGKMLHADLLPVNWRELVWE